MKEDWSLDVQHTEQVADTHLELEKHTCHPKKYMFLHKTEHLVAGQQPTALRTTSNSKALRLKVTVDEGRMVQTSQCLTANDPLGSWVSKCWYQ